MPQFTSYDSITISRVPHGAKEMHSKGSILIGEHCITAKFRRSVLPGLYDVQFVASTYIFDFEEEVLHKLIDYQVIPFLFPNQEDVESDEEDDEPQPYAYLVKL